MMKEQLSRNFFREEFACRCGCGWDTVDFSLLEGLQRLRDMTGCAITINSGCRCPEHNRAVGGSPESQHLRGKAADIVVQGYRPEQVASMASAMREFVEGGIGIYNTFTHVDVRRGSSRWDFRTGRG